MPQAQITINAIVGSNIDLPLNMSVQLNNNGIGGEVSYLWTILDQPPGAVDSLSSTSIQNPTFTPQKEGTYLLRLIVNSSLPPEQTDSVVAAVRQLKTRNRIPAAGETTQADFADGWATDTNALLRRYDQQLADPGPVVCVNKQGSVITRGNVVRVTSGAVIKLGLPGQETVPGITLAPATTLGNIDELLLIVEGDVLGNTNVAIDAICVARIYGRIAALPLGAGAVGDTVFVSDTATLATTAGTNRRRAGSIMSVSGGNRDIWFDGVGGQDITPIDRRYLVYGPPSPLTNAVRVDGPGGVGGGNVSGGVPVLFKAADAGTVPLEAQGFAAGTYIQRWLTDSGAAIMRVVRDGVYDPTRGGLELLSSYLFNAQFKSTADAASAANIFRRSATQTGALLEWFDELNNTLGLINPNGDINLQDARRVVQLAWPSTVGDAVNKAYLDEMLHQVWPQNLVQNGAMDLAQRIGPGVYTNTVINTRTFHLDRWAAWITNVAAGVQISQQLTSNVNWLRLVKSGTGATGIMYATQEIDRSLLDKATLPASPAVPLVLTFRASITAGNFTVRVRVCSGTSPTQAAPTVPAGTYATGHFTEVDAAVTNGLNTIFIIPRANRGAISLQFYITLTGSVTGGSLMVEFTETMLTVAQPSLPSPFNPAIPPFRRSNSTVDGEILSCQRFYQKSYELGTAPGSSTSAGRHGSNTIDINVTAGSPWNIGNHPRFTVPMRIAPAVQLWTIAGTAATWTFVGATQASSATNISTVGFEVANATGGTVNPGKGLVTGHWDADAEL